MILDTSTQFAEIVNKAINAKLSELPFSFPCKVTSIDDSGVYVNLETLLSKNQNDTEYSNIPIMQSPYITAPIKEGDIGIALNCSFLFDLLIEDKTIEFNQKTIRDNALFFIPIVSKANQQNDIKNLTLLNQNKDIKQIFSSDSISFDLKGKNIIFDNTSITTDLSIVQNSLIDISGSGGELINAFDIMVQLMDLLASGMSGSATSPTAYQGGKDALITQLKTIIKG